MPIPSAASSILGQRGQNLSIMIPNYNNAHYIGETLHSLLAVGSKIADAQIEVLDNCSTDNSEAVVKEVGRGRVRWTQHSENLGTYRNHNLCFEKAERDWVHILHSDDTIFASAYEEFDWCLTEMQAESDKLIGAVFGRCVYGNGESVWEGIAAELGPEVRGLFDYHPMKWTKPPMHFLSTITRREIALALGGFDAHVGPVADWDFWWRLNRQVAAAYTNQCLGFYRLSPTNHSAALAKTAGIARSGLEQLFRIAKATEAEIANPHCSYQTVKISDLFDPFFDYELYQCYQHMTDSSVVDAYLAVLSNFPFSPRRLPRLSRLWLVRQKKRLMGFGKRGRQ